MRTIYQGRPPESQTFCEIPEGFVTDYKRLGYEIRELVLLSEAETAKIEYFNAAIAQAATVAAERGQDDVAARIRKLAMRRKVAA